MDALLITVLIIVGLFILSGIKVINQYERGVVLTLGRFTGIRSPGLRTRAGADGVSRLRMVHRARDVSRRATGRRR